MVANGTSSRKWANGPSVPLTTPFRDDESVDHEALAKQVVRLAKAGEGIVLLGTNGEGESLSRNLTGNPLTSASHLSQPERKAAVETARKALDSNGFQDAPLLVGTGGKLIEANSRPCSKLTSRRIRRYNHRAHQGGCRGWSYPLYRHLPW